MTGARRAPRPGRRSRLDTRFDARDDPDPMQSLGNLVDVMLVFACGLIAALVAGRFERAQPETAEPPADRAPSSESAPRAARRNVERGRELPQVPERAGADGSGYQAVGRVYRDEKTGKLILIGD